MIALAAEAHRRRVVTRFTAVVAGGLVTEVACGLGVTDAGASPSGATASVSGALKGTLTTPAADCGGVTATSGEIDFHHSLRGHSGTEWPLFFTAPHSGTCIKPQIGSSGHGLVHVKGTWNCS